MFLDSIKYSYRLLLSNKRFFIKIITFMLIINLLASSIGFLIGESGILKILSSFIVGIYSLKLFLNVYRGEFSLNSLWEIRLITLFKVATVMVVFILYSLFITILSGFLPTVIDKFIAYILIFLVAVILSFLTCIIIDREEKLKKALKQSIYMSKIKIFEIFWFLFLHFIIFTTLLLIESWFSGEMSIFGRALEFSGFGLFGSIVGSLLNTLGIIYINFMLAYLYHEESVKTLLK